MTTKTTPKPRRLWEPVHSYYCNNGNYFNNDCGNEFNSWASFLENEGDSDLDYNLLFRWDWDRKEKTLSLYWMGQRKGLYRYTVIRAMHPDEEPSVRAWLEWRWRHLASLWAPISGAPEKSDGESVSNGTMPPECMALLPGGGRSDE